MRLIADCHADTLSKCLDENKSLTNKKYSFNLTYAQPKSIQCLAAYVSPRFLPNGYQRAMSIINKFYSESEKVILLDNIKSIENFEKSEKVGVVLTIENGSAIDGNLDNVDSLYNKGIRIMGITWNDDNDLGCANETHNDTGLTELGKKYIKKLNDKNITIDLSHASDKSFYDVLRITNKPIIATHSNARSVCNNIRNLTDKQIKEIARCGGLIGVCFYSNFLKEKGRARVKDIIKHITYIADLVGVKYIAFGSDFDGMEKWEHPKGIKNVKDFDVILEELSRAGFSQREIDLIAGENFYNFYFQSFS